MKNNRKDKEIQDTDFSKFRSLIGQITSNEQNQVAHDSFISIKTTIALQNH